MDGIAGLHTYLEDHLAGAVAGIETARRLARNHEGSHMGEVLASLAGEIEEDRQTLETVMRAVGATPSPLKQAGGWVAEKLSRIKMGSAAGVLGTFQAIETLSLGVEGEADLWQALAEVKPRHAGLSPFDFDRLTGRAHHQRSQLEQERLALASRALA